MTNRLSLRRLWLAGWAPLLVVAVHSALAAALGHQRQYDPGFHFAGGAAGAYCLLRAFNLFRAELGPFSRSHPFLVVMALMFAVVAVWEGLEFGSDRLLGTRVQAGLEDTTMDMVLGVLGASSILAVASFTRWPNSRSEKTAV
jgi:hypothetical protein